MKRVMHKAGMIFFVLVISCLIAFGCAITMNVTESNSDNIVNAGTQNNISANNNGESASNIFSGNYTTPKVEVPEIPKSEYDFNLGHKAECTNQATCTCMQDIWNEAIQKSLDSGKNVKVTLMNNWVSKNDSEHSLGEGVGFGIGTKSLVIPDHANITIDLNGFTIDRKFEELNGTINGAVCVINKAVLNLIDGSFDETNINLEDVDSLNNLPFGKITGGNGLYNGGAIHIGQGGTLNFYSGMLSDNYATYGAGICAIANSTLNMYGGLICNNSVTAHGGGICAIGANVNLYGGYIVNNEADSYAGGIYITDDTNNTNADGYFYMYGGVIANNSGDYGVGVSLEYHAEGYIYGGKIINNFAKGNSAGLLVFNSAYCEMYGGTITGNKVTTSITSARPGGSGVLITSMATFILYDGEISNNIFETDLNRPTYGAGIFVENRSMLFLKGGYIFGNQIFSHVGYKSHGGGITHDESSLFELQGPAHVFDNKEDETFSDVYLRANTVVNISDRLQHIESILFMGIKLADDYGDNAFTNNYSGSVFNREISPSRLFFSSDTEYAITRNENGELILNSSENKATSNAVWKWEGSTAEFTGFVDGKSYAVVPYTGEKYTISSPNGVFHYFYNNATASAEVESYEVINAGSYAFATTNTGLFNQTFTFTILPKEVDIVWQHTDLIYNGVLQKPTAYIVEDPNCNVITIGEQINSGSGFMASAIELSNKNYKINPLTMNKLFSISKAKLNRPTGSGNFEYDGSQKEFTPNGYNFVTMNIVGNTATNTGDYTATISIKDKHNYEWVDGGTEDIVLPYSITLTPPIDQYNGVYKFMYIDTEDGKEVRKTYAQGGIVHGINDMTLNGGVLVLGGISPNTSIKTFLDTLGFDKTKVTLRDNKGNDVFKNNAPVDASNYDNGKEYAVGTGWRVIYNNKGNTEEIYLSVLGDINGDGRISASDVATLREIANNKAVYESLRVEIKLASMVINKGNVTTADAEIVKNVIDRLFDINVFF